MLYFTRNIEKEALELAANYPVLTITGPRQSGKTTLARHLFGELPYFSFENPDLRSLVINDPRKFLSQLPKGAILDEIQNVPDLISYLQEIADEGKPEMLFVLTGSNHFAVMDKVTQSLAGRTGILKLLPMNLNEIPHKELPATDKMLLQGFYPAIFKSKLSPAKIYRNYYETYLQKDIRQLIQVRDLNSFDKFVRICAGRTGSLLNTAAIANETGLSNPTIKSWLSVLEASYIIMLIQPFYENINKRLIKSPKLYFCDVGLASYLLGISDTAMMSRDPLRGALFENMVVMEIVKHRFNSGQDHQLYFFRDSHHNEVDLVLRKGRDLTAIEIKSSQTFHPDFIKGLNYIKSIFPDRIVKDFLIYDGTAEQNGERSLLNFRTFSDKISELVP
jgi:predicted AAA+ superfamily ATPase